jgi:flagellar motor switch protein FliN/FliY
MNILMEVKVEVTGKLGTCDMTMREVMELAPGTIVQLKQRVQDPVLLCLNDRVVAKGEVVVVEDSFGIKITEMIETT